MESARSEGHEAEHAAENRTLSLIVVGEAEDGLKGAEDIEECPYRLRTCCYYHGAYLIVQTAGLQSSKQEDFA